jgi:hypothetical protein
VALATYFLTELLSGNRFFGVTDAQYRDRAAEQGGRHR